MITKNNNVKILEMIDAQLDVIDVMIASLEMSSHDKRQLSSLAYQMYEQIEKSVDINTAPTPIKDDSLLIDTNKPGYII
jgi:hypothetical protein